MVTLALDTTTRVPSSAVHVNGRVEGEWVGESGRSPAEQLPTGLVRALDAAGRRLSDVDVLAVAVGPGSFTGLRVGIATMQGLAFAQARPLIGVSALDALAASVPSAGLVATWVDASRNEVYAGLYDAGRAVRPPLVGRPDDLLREIVGPVAFVGDGATTYGDAIVAAVAGGVSFPRLSPCLAASVARLAAARALAGEHPDPDAVQPLYVQRPGTESPRDTRRAG